MANPSLVVRVAANLTELKANLAEGVNQIETTQQALSKMSSAYDGSKIIQQANATAAAIQQIGGVSNLTSAEQAKANGVLQAALDKYAILGKDAPAGMQALADATKQVTQNHSDLLGTVKDVAAAFGLAYSVKGVIDFLESVSQEAKQLQLLSLQTRTNVEDLQVLSIATRDYGIQNDELGKALFQLQQRIAGGDESVATAYHMMGISLDEVKGKNAIDLFLATERGLGTLSGAVQDTAAQDLYGGRLGASMIAFSSGADDAIEKARALNAVASTESVAAAAEYSDAIDKMTTRLHAWTTEVEGGAAIGFNTIAGALDKGASKWQVFVALAKDWASSSTVTGASASHLADLLDQLNQRTDANAKTVAGLIAAHVGATETITAETAAMRFMIALQLDSAKPLLSWQTEYLGQLKDIGELNAKNAAAIGVNVDQYNKYVAATKAAAEAEKAAAEATAKGVKDIADLQGQLATLTLKNSGDTYDAQRAQIQRWIDDELAKLNASDKNWQAHRDLILAVGKQMFDGLNVDSQALWSGSIEAAQQAADKAQATFEAATEGSLHYSQGAIQNFRALRDEAVARLHEIQDGTDGIGKSLDSDTNSMKLFIDAADKAAKEAQKLLDVGNSMTYDLSTDAGVEAFRKANPGASINWSDQQIEQFVKNGGTLQDLIQMGVINLYAKYEAGVLPGFAGGVDNFSGGMAVVGENGPEIINLPRGSSVYPNGTMPASVVINAPITINGSVLSNKDEIARVVGDALMYSLRGLGVRLPTVI